MIQDSFLPKLSCLANKALLALTLVLLAGCALSPQAITVAPAVQVHSSGQPLGRSFSLRVEDARPSPRLGSRGGVDRDRSGITLSNDLAQVVANQAMAGLLAWGLQPQSANADLQITLRWESLRYGSESSVFPSKVSMSAAYRVIVMRGDSRFEKAYGLSAKKRFATIPNAQQSGAAVSKLMSQTLQQLFADGEFKTFLTSASI